MKEEEEKCCGNCCWFCFEDTEGEGQCMRVGYHGSLYGAFTYCGAPPCKHYDSREERDRRMETLLQIGRWANKPNKEPMPDIKEICKAAGFAHRYIKVFSEL